MSTSWLADVWRKVVGNDIGADERSDLPIAAEEWERMEEVLNAAIELPPAERAGFLARSCTGRTELRREVESLLAVHEAPGILDLPAAELAAPLLASVPPLPVRGRTVSHYEILEKAGSGGMGVVYQARDLRLGRLVALKFLPPLFSTDEKAKDRFRLEAQAAAALDHPNICTIHEIGETADGQLYLAMPFYSGETLDVRIARGPLPIEDAFYIAAQAANGLARVHERGIVHRDVKPANLMVTAEGVVKILDFGIAKLIDLGVTGPGTRPGTVAYMSPEQASGETVDHRSDLWSLGVVLYEMLTGTRPFRGAHEQAVLHAVRHGTPDPVAVHRPELPPALERVLGRAMARDPADRFPSADQLAHELERALRTPSTRLADAGVVPEGERRQVTIVAATLSGFATLVERLIPNELDQALRELELAADGIARRHGGWVNQVGGERLVLLFGIPKTHEDDPIRAVRAARELHAEVTAWRERLGPHCGGGVRLHVGIDTGQVVAQHGDGHDERHRVVGSPVQVAESLATHALADEIWIGPDCLRFVEPFFDTEPRDALAVRGREHPLVPRRVVRESGMQSRLDATERAGLTRYVGREEELTALRRELEAAIGGAGALVTVTGEAGIGKSRLLLEFRRELDADRVTVLQGRCQSYGTNTAYLPFVESLQGRFGVEDSSSPRQASRQVVDRTREIAPELEEFIPFYLHLLSLSTEEHPLPRHLHGEQLRLAMHEALCAFLTVGAQRRPAVVLLEDWHWIDDASHAVLRELAEMVAAHPLLLVVTCRPGHVVDWGNPSRHAPVFLQPLDESASLAMLCSVLGVPRLPEELGQRLHERTGGNPFFLEEVCHALLEEGTLSIDRERVELTGSPDAIELPDTIQAVIRSRLDRLSRDGREVLRLAAVVGREFTRPLLERTLTAVGRLPNALQELKRSGLIHQTRVVPEAAYRFKHVLIQETAYASLLEHQRRELHGRVGEAIEELYDGRLDDSLDRLADHFSRALSWRKAVRYAVLAARRTAALNQFAEALQLLERAAGWLDQLPEGTETREMQLQILLEQERLCETIGERGRQQRIVDELIAILKRAGDPENLAEAYLRQGDLYTLLRRFDQAEAALNRSLGLRRELADEVGERNTLRSLGLLRWHQDRNDEALAHVEDTLAIDRRRNDVEAVAGDLANKANILKAMGEHERARACLEEALDLCETSPEAEAAGREDLFLFKYQYILHNLANIHRELGDDDRAVECLNRAIELSAGKRLPVQLSYHYTSIAHIYLQQGRVEESIAFYKQAIPLPRAACAMHWASSSGAAASTSVHSSTMSGRSTSSASTGTGTEPG